LKERQKKYRESNREKIKEADKQYREKNKYKVLCECGCEVSKCHLKRHQATKKHIDLIKYKFLNIYIKC